MAVLGLVKNAESYTYNDSFRTSCKFIQGNQGLFCLQDLLNFVYAHEDYLIFIKIL